MIILRTCKFSELTFEQQKEFSKSFDKLKSGLARKVEYSIANDIQRLQKVERTKPKKIGRVPEYDKVIGRKLKSLGGKLINNRENINSPNSSIDRISLIKPLSPDEKEYAKEIVNDAYNSSKPEFKHLTKRDRKRIISGELDDKTTHLAFIPKSDGSDYFGHEVGHLINASEMSKSDYIKHKSDLKVGKNILKGSSSGLGLTKTKRKITNKNEIQKVLDEERNASKHGLELLTEAGASSKDMGKATKNLKNAYQTYNLRAKIHNKSVLANRLDPKNSGDNRARNIKRIINERK